MIIIIIFYILNLDCIHIMYGSIYKYIYKSLSIWKSAMQIKCNIVFTFDQLLMTVSYIFDIYQMYDFHLIMFFFFY